MISPRGVAPSLRTLSWTPLLASTAVAVTLALVRQGESASAPLQVAAFLLGTATAFAVDDPAAETLAASPAPLLTRRLYRVVPMLLLATVVMVGVILIQGNSDSGEVPLLLAMFAGFSALALAIGGVAARWRGQGGAIAAPSVFAALITSTIVPPRWRPLPTGDIPGGPGEILRRWLIATVVGAAVFLWSSRDPGRSISRD